MTDENELPVYEKPSRDKIPYLIAARSVFKPEDRENERGLFIGTDRKCPYVLFIHREYWEALPARSSEPLSTPVNHIRLTDTGGRSCVDQEDCKEAVRELQREHMLQGFPDIKYNFLVGGDGTVFEGRGWSIEPDRPEKYSNLAGRALDIAYIGNYQQNNPSWEMEKNVIDFIKYGVDELIIERKHGLTGYRE